MESSRIKIAIFTSDESVWFLPLWAKTLPILSSRYEVVGVWVFPDVLSNLSGYRIFLWYLKTFGVFPTIILGIYASFAHFQRFFSTIPNWKSLTEKHNLFLKKSKNPNSNEVVDWVKENAIDVVLITVGQPLGSKIIKAPRIGTINKHAALLPHCRGLFPFFWSILSKVEPGISFHEVIEKIDSGRILVRRRYRELVPDAPEDVTMFRFYRDVYHLYPTLICEAIEKLQHKSFEMNHEKGSYHSLPTRKDYRLFQKAKGRVARLKDLFYIPGINRCNTQPSISTSIR